MKQRQRKDGFQAVPWGEYHATDAVSNTMLGHLARSPAACKLFRDTPPKETRSMILGRALHSAILEPLDFTSRFVPVEFDGRTREGKAERAALDDDKTGIPAKDFAFITGMASSIRAYPRASSLIAKAVGLEETAFWTRNGRRCKGRIDIRGADFIADIKTTADLIRFSPWSIRDYAYHRQAAWYLSCFEYLDVPQPSLFYFIVVVNSAPYECAIFRLDRDSIEAGRIEASNLFDKFLACERENKWTQYAEEIQTASLFQLEGKNYLG